MGIFRFFLQVPNYFYLRSMSMGFGEWICQQEEIKMRSTRCRLLRIHTSPSRVVREFSFCIVLGHALAFEHGINALGNASADF